MSNKILNKNINIDVTLLNHKCDYILTAEQGHRVLKCFKCGDVKPI
jgi:hypothetical protein